MQTFDSVSRYPYLGDIMFQTFLNILYVYIYTTMHVYARARLG